VIEAAGSRDANRNPEIRWLATAGDFMMPV